MAEGYGTFGREMKTSGKLHEMLNHPSITPESLFEVNNINGDITQNIQAFLSFCSKRREFTTKMLKICLNSSYEHLQDAAVKRVAQHTIDVLTNDQDALTTFLFNRHGETKSGFEIEERVQQQTTLTIESEAERLFNDLPSKNQQAQWQKQPDAFEKYELVKMTLAHLLEENKNQTCLGYINKLYSSLLKRQGNLFLQFLKQKPQYLDLLIKNINYFSMGNIIALCLSCEDKTGQYKYEGLKKQIFQKIIAYSLQNIEKSDNFDGFIATAEEILSTTKQSYYQYFEDFKRCANVLVSEEILRKYYQLLQKGEAAFRNASIYLELVIKRINSESEQHDYYKQNQNSEPTMNFQHGFFFNQFQGLLDLIGKSQSYSSMTRVGYLGFLINLIKNMQNKNKDFNISNLDVFKRVMTFYSQEKIGGLVKNYLFQILKLIVKKLKENQIKQLASWLIDARVEQQTLEKLFRQFSHVETNSHTDSCFVLSILFDVQNKQNTFLGNYASKNDINLISTYEKYKTKLANYGQEDEMTSPTYDDTQFLTFKMATKGTLNAFVKQNSEDNLKQAKSESEKQPETQVVGKNSVVIPVLHLPNKIENTKVIVEEQVVQPVKNIESMDRQALIRNLKNTRITLPNKFMQKKPEEQQKKSEVKSEITKQLILQQEPLPLEIKNQIPILNQHSKPVISVQKLGKQNGLNFEEQKYFIRHILLF